MVNIMEVENGDAWKMSYHADALCIGQEKHRRDVMELLKFPDVDLA